MAGRWRKYCIAGVNTAAMLLVFGLVTRVILFLNREGSAFPHWDEWRFQNDKSFLTTIFSLNNENFQIFTNAMYWLAPQIGIPFWCLRYISLLLLLMTMFVLYRLLKDYVPVTKHWLLILAFVPCLSAYMCGNLLWTVLSQSWLFFLFTFGAVNYGFAKPQTPKNQFVMVVLLMAAFAAMNITLPVIFAGIYGTRACLRDREINKDSFYLQLLVAIIILMTAFLLYGIIRASDSTEFSVTAIFTAKYWLWLSYALCGVWSGFLISIEQAWFYYLCGMVMLLGLCILFIRQIPQDRMDGVWAVVLILLGGMALIVLFRGEAILAINDHAVRHIIYGIFLIPAIYTLGIADKNKIIRLVADIWLITVLICSLPTFSSARLYKNAEFSRNGDACLMQYLDIEHNNEAFTCVRYFDDVREPYRYFVTHDAAFRKMCKNSKCKIGFVPYHFEGTVFYKIPGKNIQLFR